MTKKTLTVYGMLFLFVFTFALSLTLATSVQAVNCCVYDWCGDPPEIGSWGHLVKGECVLDGSPPCDVVYICEDLW